MFRAICVSVVVGALIVAVSLLSCRESVPLPPLKGAPLKVPEASGGAAALAAKAKEELKVIYAAPRGQLTSPHLQLTVSFSKPMVALDKVEEQMRKSPLLIQPPVKGKQRWLGTRTLVFESKKSLPGSTTFTVQVPKGVKASDGSALAEEHTWEFTTPLLKVSRINPYRGKRWIRPDASIELYFNQPVSPATLEEHLKLHIKNTALSFRVRQGRNNRHMVVHPRSLLPLDSRVEVRLDHAMAGIEGTKPMGTAFSSFFNTYGPLRVTGLSCAKDCDPEDSVVLRFSNPVRRDLARRAVRVSGKRLRVGTSKYTSTAVYINTKLAPRKRYQVTVQGNLKDKFGQKLQGQPNLAFTTGDLSPYVYFPLETGVLEAGGTGGALRLPIYFRNAQQARLLSRPMSPADVADLLGRGGCWDSDKTLLDKFAGTRQQDLKVKGKLNARVIRRVSLEQLLGGTKAKGVRGLLALELDARLDQKKLKERRVQRAVVRITDLALTAKYSPNASLVWVTSLSKGEPVSGAEVAIWRPGGKAPVWQGKTDAAGLAFGPGTLKLGLGEGDERKFIFFAHKDGDRSYVLSSTQSGISPWDFGYDATWDDNDGSVMGLVFSDRGIYRPGERVFLKGVVRRDGVRGLSTVKDEQVELVVSDSRGEKLQTFQRRLSEFGTLSAEVQLPAGAPLGSYSVVLKPAKGGTVYGDFRVEEYRPAEFKVAVKPERRQYVRGDLFKWSANGAYLFGAPMRKSKLQWNLYRTRSHFSPPKHPGYVFSDRVWRWSENRPGGGFVARGKGALDSRGDFSSDYTLKPTKRFGPWSYELEATVTDISRQSISSRVNVLLHPAVFYAGARPEETFLKAGERLKTQVLAVTPQGERLPGKKLKGTLYHRQWHSVRKEGMGGSHYFISRPTETAVGQCHVTSARTPQACEVRIPKAGYYVFRLQGQDRRNNKVMSSFGVYAAGKDYVAWRRDNEDRVELVTDRKLYKVGQSARILIKSPYARAHGLLTVERNGIYLQKSFKLAGTSAWMNVPITKDLVPNAYVSVVLVRGRVAAPKPAAKAGRSRGYQEEDPGKPAFKVGYARLDISHADHRLKVDVKPQQSQYRPGQEVTVDLAVHDARGKPAQAELTVVVADEGVLTLMGYKMPDPMSVFYARRGLSVRTADNRIRLISRRVFGEKGSNPGGGGAEMGAAPGSGVRRDFVSTPFFDPAVITDKQGKARVSFKLPDNLTTFRIMALAVSRDSEFGASKGQIKVNKPLLMLPTLPRFVRVGDDLEAGVVVHNNSSKSGSVKVEAQASGVKMVGPTSKGLTLPDGQSGEARFKFAARTPGEAVFRFTATLGDFSDSLELKRPVQLPLVLETVATYGSTSGAEAEGVVPSKGVRHDVGGLEVALSSSALVGLKGGMEYLLEYPYECLEQTTSRMVPLVLLQDLSKAYGLKAAGGADTLVAKLLARMAKMQRWDGGFSYWPASPESSPWVSAYAAWGLSRAKALGRPVSKRVLDRARSYLKSQLRRKPPKGGEGPSRSTKAYMAYVLVEMGEKPSGYLSRLYEHRADLAIFGKALLLSALVKAKGDKEMIKVLSDEVIAQVHQTARVAKVEENLGDGYAPLFHSDLRSTALALEGLLLAQPNHALVEKLVRYLLQARKNGRWRNTQETVYSLLGLHRYYQVREKEVPDFSARVYLGDRRLLEQSFKGRSLEVFKKALTMKELQQGAGTLGFIKEGAGRLYYSASLRYARSELPRSPLDAGFYVSRTYERVGPDISTMAGLRGIPGNNKLKAAPEKVSVNAGDMVRVTLRLIVPQQMHFVAVDDPLPAGLEAVNFKLMTSSRAARSYRRHGYRSRHGHSSTSSSWYTPFYQQDLRDDRVQLFADAVSPGIYDYVYLARATTKGSFVAPPTHVEQMYEPEVFGRTGAVRLEVK